MPVIRTALLLLLLPALALAQPVSVCIIGDSIPAGFYPATYGLGKPLAALHAGTDFAVKSIAHPSDKVADFQALYRSDCKGRGYTDLVIGGPTNNLPDGTAAADIYAVTDAIATEAEADTSGRPGGMHVFLLAIKPRGTGASWTSDLGARLLAYNTLVAARSGSVYVDSYTPMVEPASSPPALATAYGGATDGLHLNNAGEAEEAALINAAVIAAGGW